MSEIAANLISANGAIRLRRQGSGPIDIPASGVLDVFVNQGSVITLGGGGASELRGIRYLDVAGNLLELDQDAADLKFWRTVPGVEITIRHNATEDLQANAIGVQQRILTTSSNDFVLRTMDAKGSYAFVAAANDFSWYFSDEHALIVSNPADWPPDTKSIFQAFDYLGAQATAAKRSALVIPTMISALGGTGRVIYRGPSAKLIGMSVVLDGELTQATSATYSALIEGVAVTDGAIVIEAADAGADTKHSATPTANNSVSDGSLIRVDASSQMNLLATLGAVTLLFETT